MPKLTFAILAALALAGCGGPAFLPVVGGADRPTLVPLDEILGDEAPAPAAD